MINSGEFVALEALRTSDAARHYSHAASAIQYRTGSQVRHFWPPTPPPDGRYGSGSGRPPSVMMPPVPQDPYFDHLHHHKAAAYLATPPPLESPAGHPSAFSMYGGLPPKPDGNRRDVKRYPAPSSKPVPTIHDQQQQHYHYRHPSVIVKQEVASDDDPVQPTNLVVHKSSRLSNNKFIHSIQNSPFSPPATSQSALSSLQSLVEQSPKLKHPPPVGCVLPMPSSNHHPAARHPHEPKKFSCSADAAGNIPIGIAHAHQRPKDLSCDQIDANPSPLKSHLLSKPTQKPLGLIRDFKEECLEKFPPSYPGSIVPHHPSGVLTGSPGSRWPWLPPVWPAIPEGCQLVKDPRTGQLLLLEPAGTYTLMGPPTNTSSHSMWGPYPGGGGTCYEPGPKLEDRKAVVAAAPAIEPLAIIKKEEVPLTPSPPAESPAKPTLPVEEDKPEVIDLTIPSKEEEEEEEEKEKIEKINEKPPTTDGLQLLLDGIELKKPPSNFELLCTYAHEVFEKEMTLVPALPRLTAAQKSDVSKKVLSLTAKPEPAVESEPASELKMRQRLADLQRKYQENQRGLAELTPKKKTSKHKQNRPKKPISALEPPAPPPNPAPPPTKAAVKQLVATPAVATEDKDIDVPLSRLRAKPAPAAKAEAPARTEAPATEDKKNPPPPPPPPPKLKRTLSSSSFNMPKPKKASSTPSPQTGTTTPKKSAAHSGTESSSPRTEPETPPKKELKSKAINIKGEKGQKTPQQTQRQRKLIRPRRHSTSRPESTETIVDKVSRNLLFMKAQTEIHSGDEEEVTEDEPSFEKKRLRTKSSKKTETSKSRLSKTQASLSIRKQMGQQQKNSPEKKEKQTIVKRTRLSLVRRQSTSRLQRSSEDSPLESPSKRGLRKEEDACVLRDHDMVENTRVLVLEDGLLYPGMIIDIQPPKVYGVVLDGGRGTSPRLYSREELSKQAVQEMRPSKLLPEGSRVCAYWSQHYQCLYPGVVSKGEMGGSPDGKSMFVQFDDGDSGKIPLGDIRFLASHIMDPTLPEPAESPRPSPQPPAEPTRALRKKKTKPLGGKPPLVERKKKNSVIRPSLRLRLSRALRQRSSPGYHHFYHRSRMANNTNTVTPKPDNSKPSPTKTESSSTRPPSENNNLWRWCGKPFRKIGAKGKTKREYFRAISRKNEKIVVGECVTFYGRGSPHVGRVQNLWQTCAGGSMVVRVRWFYLPQELKSSSPHLPKGGLYQSSYEEDNDVQSISHKCQVVSYEEFCQRSTCATDSLYYLAGEYDLSSGTVSSSVAC